jgi:hypothetical protein
MSFPFSYVPEKKRFVDTRNGKQKFWKFEEIATQLRAYDTKYHDDVALNQIIQDLMDAPVTVEMLDDAKAAKKKAMNFGQIWEDMRSLVPMYKRTNKNGQAQIFFVADNNEVSKIDYTDSDALVDALMHRKETFKKIREYYNQSPLLEQVRDKLSLKIFLVKMLTEYMMLDERHLFDQEPAQISWNMSDYAYKKMDSTKLVAGATPTWDEFTSRLDYPEVFMAWVWSIFEPTNNIRQILWLKGAGNDGKSSVQKAIESVIGREYCYSMKPGDEAQQWFQKNVFGKVLVNYADCQSPYLINSISIKQLTGGDTTSIEGKGENSFTGKIYSKLFVTSNYNPKINPELQAHTSRLIKIEVAPQADNKKDSGFETRLQDEIYAFLFKCQLAFNKLISKGYERLELPASLTEKMNADCASETFHNVQDFVQEFIEFGVEQLCNPSDLKRISKDYFLLEKRLSTEQYKYHAAELEAKLYLMGCSLFRHGSSGSQITMWRGFRIRPQAKLKAVK